ncbi:GspE/PulE family protein [Vibrio porteresiae]|uniref:ATPase, T2SS/T4P/T4SS family n=1 Tax=Vibrio porteresiae DSM 19223 TaxID=1123496 RepID=A0ABZ0QCQ7_9VIBR|nr:ATPase, T2SS/T4P/T4SS family [Vibrio porteresiae]WPC73680.1 ATPase, T2SS/T4P/T4SS family [Vibrio porteresiae DSM 19223]
MNTPLFTLLAQAQLLSPEQVISLEKRCKTQRLNPIDALISSRIITDDQLCTELSERLTLPRVHLEQYDWLSHNQASPLKSLLLHYHAIPIQTTPTQITIAVSDPTQSQLEHEFQFASGRRVVMVLVPHEEITQALATLFGSIKEPPKRYSLDAPWAEESENSEQEELNNAASPIATHLHQLIRSAYDHKASDIHFEPYKEHYRIRFRCDGILKEEQRLPAHSQRRFSARLKIMAQLDIAERRLPQDGRIHYPLTADTWLDIRLSSIPTQWGEKMVLRLLNTQVKHACLADLGLSKEQQTLFQQALHRPQGLILVTGPTGSGKTQTLYTALQLLDKETLNISTAEDPIEIALDGINQIAINSKIGLDFAHVLRALLRQDPDVMMIGEIRDLETALIAVKAAQTGHLVLSTLHTNSAAETILRLQQMGIEPYHLEASLSLIIAQRLVRKLCGHCKHLSLASPQAQQLLQLAPEHTLYQAHTPGCLHCHNGFAGRIGVFELLPVSAQLKHHQQNNTAIDSLANAAKQLILAGETTLAECLRVVPDLFIPLENHS